MGSIQLKYFTGTGNSLRITNELKERFIKKGYNVNISSLCNGQYDNESDWVGFVFPVYGLGIPRIVRNYLKRIPVSKLRSKAFVIITAGDSDEFGFSLKESMRRLKKKGYDVVYTDVIEMPINWITYDQAPSREHAEKIVSMGIEKARQIADELINEINYHHPFKYPQRFGKWGSHGVYWMFRLLGIPNMWRQFRTTKECNGCGICAKICPTKSIVIKNNRPKWASSCEQCMRCVNYCKREAIFQAFGGATMDKKRYIEMSFNPLNDYPNCKDELQ